MHPQIEPTSDHVGLQYLLLKRIHVCVDFGSPLHGSVVMNLTSIHEDAGLIPGLAQWLKDLELP